LAIQVGKVEGKSAYISKRNGGDYFFRERGEHRSPLPEEIAEQTLVFAQKPGSPTTDRQERLFAFSRGRETPSSREKGEGGSAYRCKGWKGTQMKKEDLCSSRKSHTD